VFAIALIVSVLGLFRDRDKRLAVLTGLVSASLAAFWVYIFNG